MSRPIKVKWKETEQQFLAMYRTERDAKLKMRLQALWRVRAGDSMVSVANTLGVSDRAVRNWIRWYRQGGIEQVRQRKQGGHGRQSKLNEVQLANLRLAIHDGVLHSNGEIRSWLEVHFGMNYSESGLYKLLQRLRVRRRQSGLKTNASDRQLGLNTKTKSRPKN